MKKITLWSMAAVVILSACNPKEREEVTQVIVKTALAEEHSTQGNEEYAFIAQPWRKSVLSFRVSGPVDQLDVYAGSHYRRGSIIAGIDPRDFRIRKAKCEATYQQMEAEYRRVSALYEKNNLPASQYEKVKADHAAAKAAYDIACCELEDTRLLAPFDGYIGEVFIEKYQDVKATQPVVTLIEIDRLKLEIYVTQDVAQSAQQAGEINVRFDTDPDRTYQAKVMEVSKGTMSNNLSYLLTAMLPNNDGQLLAGMSGKAQLNLSSNTPSNRQVTIPLSALCHRPTEGDFVWVVDRNSSTVSKRHVERGNLLPGGRICLSKGLNPGEMIATTGLRFLSEGTHVELHQTKQ